MLRYISKFIQLISCSRVAERLHCSLDGWFQGCRLAGFAQLSGWRARTGSRRSRAWLLGCGLVIALPGLLLISLVSSLAHTLPDLPDPLLLWNRWLRISLSMPQSLLWFHASLIELSKKAQSLYETLPLEAVLRWLRMEFMLKQTLAALAGQIGQFTSRLAYGKASLLAYQLAGEGYARFSFGRMPSA